MAQFYFKFLRFIATIASCAVMAGYSGFSWIQVRAPITLAPSSADGSGFHALEARGQVRQARFRGHRAHADQPLDDGGAVKVGRPPQGFVFVVHRFHRPYLRESRARA